MGIAVGRPTSTGLRSFGHDPVKFPPHKPSVLDFCESPGSTFKNNLTCYQKVGMFM